MDNDVYKELLTPNDIDNQGFIVHGLLGGYDVTDVDMFMEKVKHTISVLSALAEGNFVMIGNVDTSKPMRLNASVENNMLAITTPEGDTWVLKPIDARMFRKQLDGAVDALESEK